MSPTFSIYKVFTGSNRPPFFDLHGFYRVKSVSLFRFTVLLHGQISLSFRFTRFLQGQIGLSFSIYNVFKGSNQSPFFDLQGFTGSNRSLFFDLQCFYRVKPVSLFRFTVLLQGLILLHEEFLQFD